MARLSLGAAAKKARVHLHEQQQQQQQDHKVATSHAGEAATEVGFNFAALDKPSSSLLNKQHKQMMSFRASLNSSASLVVVPRGQSVEFRAVPLSSPSSPSSPSSSYARTLRQCMECFAQSKLEQPASSPPTSSTSSSPLPFASSPLPDRRRPSSSSPTFTVEDRIRAYQQCFPFRSLEHDVWALVDALYGNTHRRPERRLSGFSARMRRRQAEEINLARVEGLDVWLRARCPHSSSSHKKPPQSLQDLRRATLTSQAPSVAVGSTWLDDFATTFWKAQLEPLKRTLIHHEHGESDPVFLLLFFAAKPCAASLERFLCSLGVNMAWHVGQVLFELVPLSERAQITLTLHLARELELAAGGSEWAGFLLEHYVPDDAVREKRVLDLVCRGDSNSSSSWARTEYVAWAKVCRCLAVPSTTTSSAVLMEHVVLSADQDLFCTTFGSGAFGPRLCLERKFTDVVRFERYLFTGEVSPWEQPMLLWCCLLVRFARLNLRTASASEPISNFQRDVERFVQRVPGGFSSSSSPLCRAALQRMAEFIAVRQQEQDAQELARALLVLPVPADLKKKLVALKAAALLGGGHV